MERTSETLVTITVINPMTPQARLLLSGLLVASTLTGCTRSESPGATPVTDASTSTTVVPSPPDEEGLTKKDARTIGANELGLVPVLMYHRILRNPVSEYDRTPRAFLAELRRLFREGYRPIRAVDLARGKIAVPAGKTPVVLTFDDSSPEQFGYRADGSVDRRTALGLLLRFSKAHLGFRPIATLYVNERPFGSPRGDAMLRDLAGRGFELGNHTATHADLSALSPKGVQRELVRGEQVITRAVPSAEVLTMALPLGAKPRDGGLALRGSWNGKSYRHLGVMLVGAEPAPSPFSKSFRSGAIPRIRTSSWNEKAPNYGSEFWLDFLRKHPRERYVSDGDPRAVSFPRRLRAQLARRIALRKIVY